MKLFKKLKSLLFGEPTRTAQTARTSKAPQTPQATQTQPPTVPTATPRNHLAGKLPITERLMAFLTAEQFLYEHRTSDDPSESQIQHLIVPFTDEVHEWTCVFRINEHYQLLSIFGVLPQTVPHSHFAMALMAIAAANLNIIFGSIELDPTDGEMRAKVGLDVEFSHLDDRAITCYLQAVISLTEIAQKIFDDIISENKPSLVALDYLHYGEPKDNPNDASYFEPTEQYQ
ncbi:hypothetical protein [Moraxella marmotae]|uniref:hypothetical protein n=1 Tax=Moraxella marmotae TaxID=3344520 RepID=UPI0035F24FE9